MRAKESKRLVQHGFTAPLSRGHLATLESMPASRADMEPHLMPCGDAAEAHGTNWETAWIDLGGEG